MNANELADRLDKISYDCTIEEWRASPVGEAAAKLRQQQESIEGLTRDYDLLFAEHQLLRKKEWVSLTDEARQDIALEVPIDAVFITEAVLKDKNTRG